MGELVSLTTAVPANGRTTPPAQTFAYDGFSRPTTITSSRGKATVLVYDQLDRLTKATYDDGHWTEYAYDEDGNQKSVTDKTSAGTVIHSETYTYDAMNRLSTDLPSGGTTRTYTWDANSKMLSFTDTSGTLTYGYDAAGSLTSLVQPGGTCSGYNTTTNPPTAGSLCTLFAVDRSRARQLTYPGNQVRQTTTYDSSSRLSTSEGTYGSGSGIDLFSLTYDYSDGGTGTAGDTGHIPKRTNTVTVSGASTTTTTTYTQTSKEGFLTKAVNTGGSTNSYLYCYDNNGNRTSTSTTTCPGGSTSTWDGANQQLTGPTGTAADYTYDVDGDETSSGTSLLSALKRTSTWTDSNQASCETTGTGSALPNAYLAGSNDYLVSTKVNATNTHSLINSLTGVTQVTVNNGSSDIAKTWVQRDPSGTIVGFQTDTGSHYFSFTDIQGSILYVVGFSGTIYGAYTYDPYGTQTVTTTPGFTQHFGYTSAYTNPGTGLIHLGAHFYDPTLGRFTQTDPAHSGSNSTAYSGDDPVNHVDPNGKDETSFTGNCGTPNLTAQREEDGEDSITADTEDSCIPVENLFITISENGGPPIALAFQTNGSNFPFVSFPFPADQSTLFNVFTIQVEAIGGDNFSFSPPLLLFH